MNQIACKEPTIKPIKGGGGESLHQNVNQINFAHSQRIIPKVFSSICLLLRLTLIINYVFEAPCRVKMILGSATSNTNTNT